MALVPSSSNGPSPATIPFFIRDKPGINLHGGAGVVLVDTGEERLGKGVSHNGGISRLAQILRDPGTRAGGKQEQCRQHEPKAADADRQPEVAAMTWCCHGLISSELVSRKSRRWASTKSPGGVQLG